MGFVVKNFFKFILTLFLNENQYMEIRRGFNWKRKKINKNSGKLDLFDYKNSIIESVNKIPLFFGENQFYGLENILERYVGKWERICMSSEHGFFMKKIPYLGIYAGLPAIITFGDFRKDILANKSDCMALKIGPYIHYAKEIYNENTIEQKKKKLGKTLLVFPAHTIEYTSRDRKGYDFLKTIKDFKTEHGFDTVIISMYFVDIIKNEHKKYEEEGYYIFSAGHRNNPDFLDRLKTVFRLSNHVFSEGIGTHIGYSICMGVPVTVCDEKYVITSDLVSWIEKNVRAIETRTISNKIKEVFLEYHEYITKEQLEICNYYFGNSEVKSPEELGECFRFIRNVYNRSLYNGKPYYVNIKKELNYSKYSQQIYDMVKTNRYINDVRAKTL